MQYACSLATIDGSIPGARTAAANDSTDDNDDAAAAAAALHVKLAS
jgi:hypothetical protein